MTGCTACDAVTEIDSDGFDFRVADKGFVWSYPERHPGRPRLIRTDIAVLYVGDVDDGGDSSGPIWGVRLF